jgi:hypothetical protein
MTTRLRAVSVLCWLAIAALLVRIAEGGGVEDVLAEPSAAGAAAVLTGLALIVVAVIVAVVLAVRECATWAQWLSAAAGVVAVVFGLALLLAGHQSGSLIAATGAVAIVAAVLPTARGDASD